MSLKPIPDAPSDVVEVSFDDDGKGHVTEPELLRHSLAYVLKRSVVRCDAILVKHLQGEISPARLSALACVAGNPGISQAALGSLLGIAGPSVFKVVDDLAQLGVLERMAGADRRSSALYLTPLGQERLARYADALKRCEDTISEPLTADELAQLFVLLSKVGMTGPDL